MEHKLQTYKGWFYVLITSVLLYLYTRQHLERQRAAEGELAKHQEELESKIKDKTQELNQALSDLSKQHEGLQEKSTIIQDKNQQLEEALANLKRAQVKLMQSEKLASVGLLAKGLAHEVNNPLNYISAALVGLEDQGIAEENPENKIYLRGIREGLSRVKRIVRSLHQLSSSEDEGQEEFDLYNMLENILTILRPEFGSRIEIKNEIKAKQFSIKGNRGELNQAFFNILLNAIQSIEGEGQIEIKAHHEKEGCHIFINDSGEGIKEEYLSKVMDPFFTTRSPGKGVGLGLSIAYMNIEKQGGKIELKSELGKGTQVLIELKQ